MRVLLFGATGMVGQGVLRECLLDPRVDAVLAVGRTATGQRHPKLSELVQPDLFNLPASRDRLAGFDACFFCLGVSSVGMEEERYRHITYGLTLGVAQTLAQLNPAMTFVYVSGMGTDSTGQNRTMWARVKGETENALLRLPFRAAWMFRPAMIVPLDGIRSKTWLYRATYSATAPLLPWLYRRFPKYVTTTRQVGLAMIEVARHGASKPVLENADINAVRKTGK
jgi:uncharacterized protein YbjT (DUF2867 family)